MHDESTAAAFTSVCCMQQRIHATFLLHATLIFEPTIGRYTTLPDVISRYYVIIWDKR